MIPIHNIVKREQALKAGSLSNTMNLNGLRKGLERNYNFQSINTLGERMINDSNLDWAFEYMLDKLEEVCDNDNESNARKLTHTLCESVTKVRQANQIGNLLKRRIAVTKGKIISKINKTVSNVKQAVGMKSHIKNNLPSPDSQYSRDFKHSQKMEKNKHEAFKNDKDSFKLECYEKILEHVNMLKNCDRVINTHALINKRFDTKKIFNEIYTDPELCVKEFCMLLDTYDVPFKAKVNICLENIGYEYDRNNKTIDKSQLAEAVAEYFIINASVTDYDYLSINEATSEAELRARIERDTKKLQKYENDETVGDIVKKVVKAVFSIIGKGIQLTASIALSVIICILGAIITLATLGFILNIVVNVILLICTIAIGLLILSIPLGILALIQPSQKDAIDKAAKTAKDRKVKEALVRLSNVLNTKSKIKEEYYSSEYAVCLNEIEEVLRNNKFYKANEITRALSFFEEETNAKFDITMEDAILGLTESNKNISTKSKSSKIVSELRQMPHKNIPNIKNKLKELYADSPNNIVKEMPNIFRILFDIIVIGGAFAINIPLGIIVALAVWFIGLGVDREMATKYTNEYKKERERAIKKGKKMKDKKMKERNEAYIKELDTAIEKLETYEDSKYTERENDIKKGYSTDDENIDVGEAAVDIILIDKAISVIEGFNRKKFYNSLREDKYDKELFGLIINECLSSGLISQVEMDRNLSNMKNTNKPSLIHEQLLLLESANIKPSNDPFRRASVVIEVQDIIQEMSFGNTLTMIKDKIKNSAQTLSDQEKIASRTLDSSIDSLRTGMENSLKQENREAVIRGQILPSASRIIKLALMTGFAFLLHPALAIIYLLGIFAMSKKLRKKERQLVLDELDTELKVCTEYIQKAKSKEDMNAYRQCLQIEKKLLRQRDRLKYKMKAEWNENTPERYSNKDYEHK